jgi:aryl-alcohol dehydrogenase-like predicted oxidoreductase
MDTRLLGKSGIRVPRLGLGCATFGREIDQADSFALMDYAAEQGMNLFDTAEAYGGGQSREYRKAAFQVEDVREVSGERHSSEKIIGRWLRASGARKQVILLSKITTNFTRAHVREALAASLERLQTDYLDVYMFHSFDPATPAEEALAAMDEAQGSGLIDCAGCSNFSGQQLRDALDVSRRLGLRRLEVVEGICNLVAREAETDLLPLCRDEQIGFLGYSPLGAGFLSGKYSGDRNSFPEGSRFHVIPGHADVYFTERNFHVVDELRRSAERMGVPPLRLAIAWVLAHPLVTTVLCGARNTSQLDNALAAYRMEAPAEWPVGLQPVGE